MKKTLIFLDTETTGIGEKDFLVQIAYSINGEEIKTSLHKPSLPMSVDAMAITHITNAMLENMPPFKNSSAYEELKKLFSDENSVFVAHNAKFDIGMLKKEGLEPKQYIDTLKIARCLDEKGEVPKYNLQYLRYLLDLEAGITEEIQAHDAESDVVILIRLFERQIKMVMERDAISREVAIDTLIELSQKPILVKQFPFGKHKGRTVEDVAKTDISYLAWLYEQKQKDPVKDEDWIYTLETYLKIK